MAQRNPAHLEYNKRRFYGFFTERETPILLTGLQENVLVYLWLHGTSYLSDVAAKCYSPFTKKRSRKSIAGTHLTDLGYMGLVILIQALKDIRGIRMTKGKYKGREHDSLQPAHAFSLTTLGEEVAEFLHDNPKSRVAPFRIEMRA